MSRRWLVAAALVLAAACSKKSSDEAPPAPAPGDAAPEVDPREQACRNNGDGAVCLTAAEHATKSSNKDTARELFAIACARGAAAACAALAEGSRTPSLWHGKACRRGLAESCATTDGWAAALRGRATGTGDLPDWLATEYLRAVEDCAAELPKAARDGSGEVGFTIAPAAAAVTECAPAALQPCLERAIALTRRPPQGSLRLVVTLAPAP